MIVSFVIYMVLLAVVGASTSVDFSLRETDHSKHGNSKQITDILDSSGSIRYRFVDHGLSLLIPETDTPGVHKRTKRTVVSRLAQGALALRTLLSGAKKVVSTSNKKRLYEKKGNYFTALKDFENVGPYGVTVYKNPRGVRYVFGWIGDRKLKIISPGVQGDTILDIIDITQTKIDKIGEPWMDRIIYKSPKKSDK